MGAIGKATLIAVTAVICARAVLHPDSRSIVDQDQQPSTVFKSVSSKVSALEAQLAEVEMENKRKLEARQAKYQTRLEERRQENIDLASENLKMAKQVEAMKAKNSELVKDAGTLRRDCDVLKQDLVTLRANVTTAFDFTTGSLKSLSTKRTPKELSVLDQLDEEKTSRGAVEAHQQRLNEVLLQREGYSMLQMQAQRGPSPKDLLMVLDQGLQELKDDAEKNQNALAEQFKELITKETERNEALKGEQGTLAREIKTQTTLNERLMKAVAFLKDQRRQLDHRARSIRAYAERLGIKALPGSQEPQGAVQSVQSVGGSAGEVTDFGKAQDRHREQSTEKKAEAQTSSEGMEQQAQEESRKDSNDDKPASKKAVQELIRKLKNQAGIVQDQLRHQAQRVEDQVDEAMASRGGVRGGADSGPNWLNWISSIRGVRH